MESTMRQKIDNILAFNLCGRFAHFRKFYTNASSLSYLVPPRTVIIGLLGSILMMPRDSYYEILGESSCKISVSAAEGAVIKKSVHSVNMLHEKYHSFLEKGKGSCANMHSQCKLELLSAGTRQSIIYRVYAAFPGSLELFEKLKAKIKSAHMGYGVYLGQRQFRAYIDDICTYSPEEIEFLEQSDYLDSICLQENVVSLLNDNGENDTNIHVVVEQMPVHMKAVVSVSGQTGREPVSVKRVLFERRGKRLYGTFKNCYRVGDKVISFY
ncbi:MAG: CRISPR-associated protein Cas5 [Candidatus Aminicenantes bacterium]|nr:CRISPR-associated protein Cas5 [Candidatus Aminicenantes bacterium]NIM77360.1 CRISPR-associated protein Cas5 [Candidatus Aminicenantes bacterium]NIN16658.1 CRISPR-associated protein Cas5 [Candidatus Aminicenantes bacterium]NIN40516.1 CRISPR-associated protein Cas5 [Candidatus Aminicenantes bacterium]NIN83336.1 CRISPR-associated protein Cas5 [Candidatus Aminicenantes bacterium]